MHFFSKQGITNLEDHCYYNTNRKLAIALIKLTNPLQPSNTKESNYLS